MTFIYVRKVEGLIFFIADTFSRNDISQETVNRFTNPLIKIVKLNTDTVVAYAGNAISAQNAFIELISNPSLDGLEHLTDTHIKYLGDDDRYVEFALSSISKMDLWFIKNGKKSQSDASFLGNSIGMEKFHEEFAKPSDYMGVKMSLLQVPNDAGNLPQESTELYSQSVNTFERVMQLSNENFGGLSIVYAISPDQSGFMNSLQNLRGPLLAQELDLFDGTTILHQDTISSGYTSTVGGSDCAVSIYYPAGSYGVIFPCFTKSRNLRGQTFRDIDGYEFTHEAKLLEVPVGPSSWTSNSNDIWKCSQLIDRSLMDRANELFQNVLEKLAKELSVEPSQNGCLFENGIVHKIIEKGTLKSKLRTIQRIEIILQLQLKLASASEKKDLIETTTRELNTWKSWIDKVRVEFSVSDLPNYF